MKPRTITIGDIHGWSPALDALLEDWKLTDQIKATQSNGRPTREPWLTLLRRRYAPTEGATDQISQGGDGRFGIGPLGDDIKRRAALNGESHEVNEVFTVGRGALGDDLDVRSERFRQDYQFGGGPHVEPEGIDDDKLTVVSRLRVAHRWLLEGDRDVLLYGIVIIVRAAYLPRGLIAATRQDDWR
jgi:hypothetical protein